MHLKTLTLELFQGEFPTLYEKLRERKALLKALDRYSTALRANLGSRKEEVSRRWPESHPAQIEGEALELALMDLRAQLSAESS